MSRRHELARMPEAERPMSCFARHQLKQEVADKKITLVINNLKISEVEAVTKLLAELRKNGELPKVL
jgi:GTP-sensing pleiotropic transcriptional regulator CodY